MESTKTIYLLVDYYYPKSKKIHAQMTEELALGIKNKGHKVIVIAPDTEISNNEIINIRGVDVKFFRNPKIKGIGFIKRTINEFLLSFNAFFQLRQFINSTRPDFIIYFSPSIFFGIYVLYLKLFLKIKTYLVLRDIFPQWAVDLGLIKKNWPIHLFFKFFEKINYSAATCIGLESPSGLKNFKSKFPKYKAELLFNWVEVKKIPQKVYSLREIYSLEDKIIYFYGGNIGLAQDISNILNLALNFKNIPRAHFVIIGDGDKYIDIEQEISYKNLKNVLLIKEVDPSVYIDFLREVDVGMISLNKEHKGNNIPGKLLNYMKLSKPILGSVNQNNDIINIVNNSNSGLISINGDNKSFFNNAKLMMESEKRTFFSENSYRLILEKFSIESAVKNVLKHIETND